MPCMRPTKTSRTQSSLQTIFTSKHPEHLLLSLLNNHHHHHQLIHSQIITSGLHHHINNKSMLLYNTLLKHYSRGSSPEDSLLLYNHLRRLSAHPFPDQSFTLSVLLKACANSSRPCFGTQLHCHSIKVGFGSHVYVQTALLNMYVECGSLSNAVKVFDFMSVRNVITWNAFLTGATKCGRLELARDLFDAMPVKNVVSWTGLIDGYTRAGRALEAVGFLRRMMGEGVRPSEITVLAVIPAISNLGMLCLGESVHAYGEKNGHGLFDVRVSNSYIDLYAKCGSIGNAGRVFFGLGERRNLVSWTSMISGFAMHGMAEEAVEWFGEMVVEGWRPNRVTLLCVLSACSHGGLVEQGLRFFRDMVCEYGIVPEVKHYGCVVDILGRAGRLEEAEKLAMRMPAEEASVVVWRTLLGSCNFHGNTEMGERVMRRIMMMERRYGGDYVVVYNMLSGDGRFGDAERVRRLLDEMDVYKVPGITLIGGKEQDLNCL